jgi:hypothetical protein
VLNFRVAKIQIGDGNCLCRYRFRGVVVELRVMPIGGFARAIPRDRRRLRWRYFCVVLAGPAVNALLLGIGLAVMPSTEFHLLKELVTVPTERNDMFTNDARLPVFFFATFVFANLDLFVGNLLPFRVRMTDQIVESDGLQLLKLLFKPKKIVRKLEAMVPSQGHSQFSTWTSNN